MRKKKMLCTIFLSIVFFSWFLTFGLFLHLFKQSCYDLMKSLICKSERFTQKLLFGTKFKICFSPIAPRKDILIFDFIFKFKFFSPNSEIGTLINIIYENTSKCCCKVTCLKQRLANTEKYGECHKMQHLPWAVWKRKMGSI